MNREKLDNFLSYWAGLVVQFTAIVFAFTFCTVTVMTCVKLIHNVFNSLFIS
jgi:hypothetical protein